MSSSGDFGNPLRKFKLVFLGEQSGEFSRLDPLVICRCVSERERERERRKRVWICVGGRESERDGQT